jgi:hypothetical protein
VSSWKAVDTRDLSPVMSVGDAKVTIDAPFRRSVFQSSKTMYILGLMSEDLCFESSYCSSICIALQNNLVNE